MEIKDIVLVIPTRGERGNGIRNCVQSVGKKIALTVLPNECGWLPTVNEYIKTLDKAFLMGADDMIFHSGAVQIAIEAMNNVFPNENGVIGFNQVNLENSCEAGFTLIGRKFIDHLRPHGLFCPDYKHYYADTELHKFATTFGRFRFIKEAKIDHYHFSVTGEKDSTALISQQSREEDKETAKKREEQGLLWGRDFTRIN